MRIFELFLTVTVLFVIVYVIWYAFIFSSICTKYSDIKTEDPMVLLQNFAGCKDTLICEVVDIEYKVNKIQNWTCQRKTAGIFTIEFYKNLISE